MRWKTDLWLCLGANCAENSAFSTNTHCNLVLLAFLRNRKHVQNMLNNTLNTGVLVPKS